MTHIEKGWAQPVGYDTTVKIVDVEPISRPFKKLPRYMIRRHCHRCQGVLICAPTVIDCPKCGTPLDSLPITIEAGEYTTTEPVYIGEMPVRRGF